MSLLRNSINALILTNSLCRLNLTQSRRHVKRWVAPTLRELEHRKNQMGPQHPEPRSGYIEWNYRAELYAFGKRLNENFQLPLLQTAFTQQSYVNQEKVRQQKLGIEESDVQILDNTELAEQGQNIAKEYVDAFLKYNLPKLPAEGLKEFTNCLISTETLSEIALHLGMKDLIYSAEYPPAPKSLEQSLYAVIGALAKSSGTERAFLFVRDFICTQMNQRDLLDLWTPEKPVEYLTEICKQRNMGEPEARLLADCGKNTVLAAYHIGIYTNKKLLGKGYGESIKVATETAAIDALQTLFDTHDNRQPFDFQMQVTAKSGGQQLNA